MALKTSRWVVRCFVSAPEVDIPGMASHLSLPFAVEIEQDVYRTFFSYRDANQRARAGSLDVVLRDNGAEVLKARGNIIAAPEVGHFDEHGVIPSSIIEKDGRLYLYYIGRTQGERSPMWYASVGLAISEDGGETFERYSPTPIFSINRLDPCLVTAPCVTRHNDKFVMFYVSCQRWQEIDGQLASFYDVRRALSDDGINWTPEGKSVIPLKNDEKNIGRPWLRRGVDAWELWYCYAGAHPYRIGRAVSRDLVTWHRQDQSVQFDLKECAFLDTMQCYASFFRHAGGDLMMLNGNRYGQDGFAICAPTDAET